jgi:hypothetical protein
VSRAVGGYRGWAHMSDGAAMGVDLTGGWYTGTGEWQG